VGIFKLNGNPWYLHRISVTRTRLKWDSAAFTLGTYHIHRMYNEWYIIIEYCYVMFGGNAGAFYRKSRTPRARAVHNDNIVICFNIDLWSIINGILTNLHFFLVYNKRVATRLGMFTQKAKTEHFWPLGVIAVIFPFLITRLGTYYISFHIFTNIFILYLDNRIYFCILY